MLAGGATVAVRRSIDPFGLLRLRYRLTVPVEGGVRHFSGPLSAWSTVNLGLEEHNWIPPSCSCFVFAHPPECAPEDIPAEASIPLHSFFFNGAYLYFNHGSGDSSLEDDTVPDRSHEGAPPVDISCAVVFVPSEVVESAAIPQVFPVELQLSFQVTVMGL